MNNKYRKSNNNKDICTFYADDGIIIFHNESLFHKISKEFIYLSSLINLKVNLGKSFFMGRKYLDTSVKGKKMINIKKNKIFNNFITKILLLIWDKKLIWMVVYS